MVKIIIELTDEQAEIIKDEIQGYAEALANDRLIQKAEQKRSELIKVLTAKTEQELAEAAAPIIAAEKVKAEAKEKEKI
ncbi:MAG: hypothetical protein LLG05_12620 [Porphyromonadaceae bacterium]|nr:hypothetical protein [Porphyromonadaceae bacterium]